METVIFSGSLKMDPGSRSGSDSARFSTYNALLDREAGWEIRCVERV